MMRSRVIFLMALIMGVITTVLFFQYIQGEGQSQEVIVEEEMAKVIVALDTIGENQTVTSEMLQVVEVPQKNMHPNTVTNADEVIGKFSTTIIEKDEILLTHRFKSDQEEDIFVSRKVTDGMRAVSIEANFVRTVSNLIEPEDFVDVIFTEEVDEGEDEEENNTKDVVESKILLSEIRVLAVGRKMKPPLTTGEYVEYNSLTLELSVDDATTIVNASHRGSLHFMLHSSINSSDSTEE